MAFVYMFIPLHSCGHVSLYHLIFMFGIGLVSERMICKKLNFPALHRDWLVRGWFVKIESSCLAQGLVSEIDDLGKLNFHAWHRDWLVR